MAKKKKVVKRSHGETLRDLVMKEMCKKGITEATAVAVTYKDGSTVTVHGDTHPALDRPAAEVERIQPRQTAAGAY